MNHSPLQSASPGIMVASFMGGAGRDLAGKHGRKTMIRKKWRAGCGKSACPVVCPAKAGVFGRSQSCQGKSQKLCSLDGRVEGN